MKAAKSSHQRLYYILTLVLFAFNTIQAAITVSGDVKSQEGNPIEFASVRIMSNDSTMVVGMQTQTDGTYKLQVDKAGHYKILVSMLGYENALQNVDATTDTTVPTITLHESSLRLNEVTVTGQNITRVDNHLLIIPDSTSVKHAFSSYQLIENLMIPGLKVDTKSGSVTMFNKTVGIFINDEPADYLMAKNLRPRDIEKIEFYDAPSGQFAQYSAVINYILKEKTFGGYLSLDAAQQIGNTMGSYNAYTQMVFGKSRLHLFGGYNVTVKDNDRTLTDETFHFSSGDLERITPDDNGRQRNSGEYGGIKFSHSGKTNSFSINAQVSGQNLRQRYNSTTTYGMPYDLIEDVVSRTTGSGVSPKLGIWEHKALPGNAYVQFKIDAAYYRNKTSNIYTQNINSSASNVKEELYSSTVSLIFGKTVKGIHNFSLQAMDFYQNSSAKYFGDYQSNQRIWRSDFLLFAEYVANIQKFRIYVRPGLSITNEGRRGENSVAVYNPRLFTQTTWTPTSNQQLGFYIAIGNGTPPLSYKTAGETATDILQIKRGNPLLVETKIYMVGLNYNLQINKLNISFDGTYQCYNRGISSWYYLDTNSQGNEILVSSYQNCNMRNYNATVAFTYMPSKYLRLGASGIFEHQVVGQLQNNLYYGEISAKGFYKDFALKIYLKPHATDLNQSLAFTTIKPLYGCYISWNHKNWMAKVAIDNPFSRAKYHSYTNTSAYELNKWVSQKTYAEISAAYTFDFGNKKLNKEAKASIRREFDSAIVK